MHPVENFFKHTLRSERGGQITLSVKVYECIEAHRHLLGEGPCGIGKTYAYLVPVIQIVSRSKRKAVIATANNALQQQILDKDLPRLKELMPDHPFTFAGLKGKRNYLCLYRHKNFERTDDDDVDVIDKAMQWREETTTGDKVEIDLPDDVWNRLSIGSDDCLGKKCHFYGPCFSRKAREVAAESDIIVTNYSLVMRDSLIKSEIVDDNEEDDEVEDDYDADGNKKKKKPMRGLLPKYSIFVGDEAQDFPEVARESLGFTIAERGMLRTVDLARKFDAKLSNSLGAETNKLFDKLREILRKEKERKDLEAKRWGRKSKDEYDDKFVLKHLEGIDTDQLLKVSGELKAAIDQREDDEANEVSKRLMNSSERIKRLVEMSHEHVFWVEKVGQRGKVDVLNIECRQIDPAPFLREQLFGKTNSVIMVSATMMTERSFEFIAKQLGALRAGTDLINVESPFNFQNQALLVCPRDAPDPKDDKVPYDEKVAYIAKTIISVIEQCDGGVMVLFTSKKSLTMTYELVAPHCKHQLLKQDGTVDRRKLTEIFKADAKSVLFGLRSYWVGVDVPGDALKAVVLEKVYFPQQHPLYRAICDNIKRQGGRDFDEYTIPATIMMMRQGAGRLIRTITDVGVVVICDGRMHTKNYGSSIRESLPPMKYSKNLLDIQKFLRARGK